MCTQYSKMTRSNLFTFSKMARSCFKEHQAKDLNPTDSNKTKRLQVSKNVKLRTSIQQNQIRSKDYRFNMLNFSPPVGYRES